MLYTSEKDLESRLFVRHFGSFFPRTKQQKKKKKKMGRKSLILMLVSCAVVPVALTTRAQDNFYFDPAPVDEEALDGDAALLRCDVSNRKHIAFYWELNGRPVTNTSRRFQDGSDLRFTCIDRTKDTGSFRCIATNVTTGVSLRSTEARINVVCEYKTL